MDTNTNSSNAFKITGDWAVQSKSLKEKFNQLTDSDLKFETGKENELFERVGKRINKKPEEVMNIIKKGMSEKE